MQSTDPYTFIEYLAGSGIDTSDKNFLYHHRVHISKTYEEYFRFGGLPELLKINDKRAWLSHLYQKIFLGDLITRYQIRNAFALQVSSNLQDIRTRTREIQAPHYQHSEIGYNYRMSNICAGIGRGQMTILDSHIAQGKHSVSRWN